MSKKINAQNFVNFVYPICSLAGYSLAIAANALYYICDINFGAKDSVLYQRHKVFYVFKIIACLLNMIYFIMFYIKFYKGKTKFFDRTRHIIGALLTACITFLDPTTDIVIYTATKINGHNKSIAIKTMGLCIATIVVIVLYLAFGMPAPSPKKVDDSQ